MGEKILKSLINLRQQIAIKFAVIAPGGGRIVCSHSCHVSGFRCNTYIGGFTVFAYVVQLLSVYDVNVSWPLT